MQPKRRARDAYKVLSRTALAFSFIATVAVVAHTMAASFESGTELYCEQRTKPDYVYRRALTNDKYGTTKVLEIKLGDFSSIHIPDSQQWVFKRVFSSQMENGKFQSLHHARPTEKCGSIAVTTTSSPPISLKPLQYEEGVVKRVQYMLLDAEGILAFLGALPNFTGNIIPWMEASKKKEVTQLSPYSTYTTTKQLKSHRVLRTYPEAKADLVMAAVQFENSSAVELRYKLAGEPRSGVFLNMDLCEFIMNEREVFYNVLSDLESTLPWKQLEMNEAGGSAKRAHNNDDEGAAEGVQHKRIKPTPVMDDEDTPTQSHVAVKRESLDEEDHEPAKRIKI